MRGIGDGLMNRRASAGHKLGQLIGDWFERHFVLPLLASVADELDLFLDNRFTERPARGEKIIMDTPIESYLYQVTYSDGSEFEQVAASLDDLRSLHDQISALAEHMNYLR